MKAQKLTKKNKRRSRNLEFERKRRRRRSVKKRRNRRKSGHSSDSCLSYSFLVFITRKPVCFHKLTNGTQRSPSLCVVVLFLFICHTTVGRGLDIFDVLVEGPARDLVRWLLPLLLPPCQFLQRTRGEEVGQSRKKENTTKSWRTNLIAGVKVNGLLVGINGNLVTVPHKCNGTSLLGLWSDVPNDEALQHPNSTPEINKQTNRTAYMAAP